MQRIIVTLSLILLFACSERMDCHQLISKWNFATIDSESDPGANFGTEYYNDNYIFLQDSKHSTAVLFGDYLNGTWSLNSRDSILSLHTVKKESVVFKVRGINENEMRLTLVSTKASSDLLKDVELVFFKEQQNLLKSAYNYTKPEYNQFRIKPTRPETEEEIRQRVKQAILYALTFFKHGVEQEKNSIKLNSINLPIRFYGNGVAMEEQSEKWNSIFYNREEAAVGYDMIESLFKKDLNLPEHKRGIELHEYILKEIYKRL